MICCDAAIRPFPDDRELRCELEEHGEGSHESTYLDSKITWQERDRRNFHGQWPGACVPGPGCVLPAGHHGRCAA